MYALFDMFAYTVCCTNKVNCTKMTLIVYEKVKGQKILQWLSD